MLGYHKLARKSFLVVWLSCGLTTVDVAAGPVTIDGPRPPAHVIDTVGLLAVDDVLEEEAAFIAAVKGGLDDISAGRVVDGESVFDEVRALLANRQK